ncbi:hypothetical protein [Methylobacterium sp. 22177]|uniref:hypothetical protein n=1 Tax=Methylobacterium sp. 22177 TaxID=3453885 RepID=UPI003F863D60
MSEIRMDAEARARVIAWRCGFVLDRDAASIQIKYPADGVVAGRVASFEDIPGAFVEGRLAKEARV